MKLICSAAWRTLFFISSSKAVNILFSQMIFKLYEIRDQMKCKPQKEERERMEYRRGGRREENKEKGSGRKATS